jgi:TIGR03009 family protein
MRRIGWPVVVLLLAASCSTVEMANWKMPPPFKSTPDEERNVDRLLDRWEQWNAGVKTFDCGFKRWTFDVTFGPPNQPKWVDLGEIKYAAPNHALYRVDTTEKDGKEVPIEDARAEHWAFDGRSVIEWRHVAREVVEYKLPPDSGIKGLDGPLTLGPFIMLGGKAKQFKEQYYVREVTPRNGSPDQIWLEAYPRTGLLAADFQKLQLIFRKSDMSPYAMKMTQPNGKDYIVYQFYDIAVNKATKPGGDSFPPAKPFGWQKIVVELPAAQVSRPANDSRR